LAQQDFAGAAEEFGASQQLRQDLSNRQPQSTLYRSALFYADFRLGLARHEQGDLAAALAAFTGAEELATQLKEGISAGEVIRLEQALKQTRDEIAAHGNAAPPPAGVAKTQ
jgi:hypothetical protein